VSKASDSISQQLRREETGAASLKSIFILCIIALIIYGGIAYIPAIQIPIDIEKEVIELCEDYLQTPGRYRARAKKIIGPRISETLAGMLEGHTFDLDNLKVKLANTGDMIEVTFPYTLNMKIIIFELDIDKSLVVKEKATRF
jgi:hypothetical protein